MQAATQALDLPVIEGHGTVRAVVFNSLTFLLFFAAVLAIYYALRNWRAQKLVLLGASYLFYAAWNPPFVALLWLSTVVDWFVAKRLAMAESPGRRKALLLVSLATNLGLLSYFKYGQFFLDNYIELAAKAGIEHVPADLGIILPVGISFYTFQTLSYTIDVYRRDAQPWPSFLDFALFVTFFPQLVAGPIVRAFDFLPQCLEARRATIQQFGWGVALIVVGLFEKMVVADALTAGIADRVFATGFEPSFVEAWTGTFAYSVQIFCDFAGYSTVAIGAAMCLGFHLPDNFRYPYAAIGFSDFWRRWHVSLSQWLRDYLYISLGGNRQGPGRTQINLMLTMLIGGLWHGASWSFVVWGGLHGLYLAGERVVRNVVGEAEWAKKLPARLAGAAVTFALVCIAWVFFRAPDFATAFDVLSGMLWASHGIAPTRVGIVDLATVGSVLAGTLGMHWLLRDTTLEEFARRIPIGLLAVAFVVMIAAILLVRGDDRAFIYFQF